MKDTTDKPAKTAYGRVIAQAAGTAASVLAARWAWRQPTLLRRMAAGVLVGGATRGALHLLQRLPKAPQAAAASAAPVTPAPAEPAKEAARRSLVARLMGGDEQQVSQRLNRVFSRLGLHLRAVAE